MKKEVYLYMFPPTISWGYDFNYLYTLLAPSNLFYRATVSLISSYTEMINGEICCLLLFVVLRPR